MSYYIAIDRYGNYDLAHHGILGQKWGIRRYQNKDGTLTEVGKKHYSRQLDKKMNKRDAYVVSNLKKHHKYPQSETESVRDLIQNEYRSSKQFKKSAKIYEELNSFVNEMANKYSDDIESGFQYFDVYSEDEWKREQAIGKRLHDSHSELGKTFLEIEYKHKPELITAAMKDLSIKDTPAMREFIDQELSSKYGTEWWRFIR